MPHPPIKEIAVGDVVTLKTGVKVVVSEFVGDYIRGTSVISSNSHVLFKLDDIA